MLKTLIALAILLTLTAGPAAAQTSTTYHFSGFYASGCVVDHYTQAFTKCTGTSTDTDALGNHAFLTITPTSVQVKVGPDGNNIVYDTGVCEPASESSSPHSLSSPVPGENTIFTVDCGAISVSLNLYAVRIGSRNFSTVYWYGSPQPYLIENPGWVMIVGYAPAVIVP